MKKVFQYTTGMLLAALTMTACQPEKFDGADQMGVPTVAGEDFTMVVDQETNQVQVSYDTPAGTYPIWIFNGASYSTLNKAGYQNNKKGTYTVEMKLANRNGFSQGTIKKEFTFNETKASFATELNRLSGKEWRIDRAEPAHLACGEYGGDGTGWWNAGPDEKKDFGVYDDRITFTSDGVTGGTFTYNPGPDGVTYINIGCSLWDNGGATADFDTPTQEQSATFELKKGDWIDSNGEIIETNFLVLTPNTLFPYISSDRQYTEPRFRIETLTASKLVLIYENQPDNISWRFIFTSKAEEKAFEGFDANSQYNQWKGITPTMSFYYNPDPAWGNEQSAQFESLFVGGDNDYTVTVPTAGYDQWQAQVHFHTDINTVASSNYDFSVILNADKDVNGATVKLTNEADGADFYFAENVDLKAGEDYIFWKSDMPGIDLPQVKLVFDFGHAGDDTHINIRNVVLKDHANDDGTVLPGNGGDDTPTVTWVAVDSPDNLGADFNTVGSMEFWWADGGWGQIGNPGFAFDNGVYIITATENGGAEWQAQSSIHNANVGLAAGQLYDVRATIEASAPVGRYTFKICQESDDDNTLVYNGSLSLEAGENTVEFVGVKAQKNGEDTSIDVAKLFIDLGGVAPGTEIRLSDIIIQKHGESAAGGGNWSYNDAINLWKAVDSGDAFISVTPWFADGGWVQIGDPDWSHDGNTWSLTIPEGMGPSQWQGQFPINTTIATKQNDPYGFSCTIVATNDLPGVTIKLTETDDADGTKHDSNFYFAERHDIKANEPYVYTVHGATLPLNDAHALSLFFDFGGSPIGTFIEISNITLVKE